MDALYNYTFPCTMGDEEKLEEIRERLDLRDATPEQVRDYFFEIHNPRENERKNFRHLCIPYEVTWGGAMNVLRPFFDIPKNLQSYRIDNAQIISAGERGILKSVSVGDIWTVHSGMIVDKVNREDVSKYDSLYPIL